MALDHNLVLQNLNDFENKVYNSTRPILVLVGGASSSGKSSVCSLLAHTFTNHSVAIISQDSYYYGKNDGPQAGSPAYNFDIPAAFDRDLLLSHMKDLVDRKPIEIPVYDYTTSERTKTVIKQEACDVIILEGILVLAFEELRAICDLKVFIDTPSDLCILRRIQRDVVERGRTISSVMEQYLETVRPAYESFCGPSKNYADIIIPGGGDNTAGISMLKNYFSTVLFAKSNTPVDSEEGSEKSDNQ